MWTSYEALCEMGASNIDPTTVFGVRPAEIDQLQERFRQRNFGEQEEMPLQEKPVLTPHHFTPPTHGAGSAIGGVGAASRPMDLGTPASAASIRPKASLFQTAQKPNSSSETGSAAILPNQLQFDTPNLTPIPLQQDASFIQQHHHHHPASAARVTFQHSSMMSEAADLPLNHVFGDSLNPHTVRRAKHVAARLYYQPSPESQPSFRVPPSSRLCASGVEASRDLTTRSYLRGRSALRGTTTSTRSDLEPNISETPVRRGGRPSDVSTVRRPRALFHSENKAMRENTIDLNQSNSSALEDDDDDDENNFRPVVSRGHDGVEDTDLGMDNENHRDDEQPNVMMMTEDNANNGNSAGVGQHSSFLAEENVKPPVSFAANNDDEDGELDENLMMEKHGAVLQILELLCLLGAGYWRLCQVRVHSNLLQVAFAAFIDI